ncbi:MAG: hypothetical protein AMJ94_18315 [Deltaproteobacteria bacterium SM23_61]|nr:MAG: hypothetical protein AMJ94_18315 [Deltaproteobacteria bacterium SM23_61]
MVVQDHIGHVLVEGALVAEGPQIELEGLGFQDLSVGDVLNGQPGKIRLPRCRADAGEFLRPQGHNVIPPGMMIGKGLQLFPRLGSPTQQGQSFQVGFQRDLRHLFTVLDHLRFTSLPSALKMIIPEYPS